MLKIFIIPFAFEEDKLIEDSMLKFQESCPICKGLGFVKTPKGVKKCTCIYKGFNINKFLHIPKRFDHASLESIKSKVETITYSKVLFYLENFKDFYQKGKGLLFIGPPGVGKTFIAISLLKEIYKKFSIRGFFIDTKDLSVRLKVGFSTNNYHKLVYFLYKVPVLVLDDLGNEELVDWFKDFLIGLINYRYNEKKVTFITTNYYPSYLVGKNQFTQSLKGFRVVSNSSIKNEPLPQKVDEQFLLDYKLGSHIISRIAEMTFPIILKGQDKRVKKITV